MSSSLSLANAAISGAAQHAAWHCTSVGGVLDDDGAVDDHGCPPAARVTMRVGVGRLVPKIVWIENSNVGAVADLQ